MMATSLSLTSDIIATTDGSTAWTAQKSGTSEDLRGITFVDAKNGWACGVKSTTAQTSGASEKLRAVASVDAKNG